MARKPTLSPSKITTYLACPVKYRWTYVDERGKWYLRSRNYYSFGTTLHRVLQRFHDAGDQGVQTVAQAVAAVEENWIEAGYRSQEEMQEALGLGKEIVATYVETQLSHPTEGMVLLIEKQLRKDLGPFVLLGRVDRVDQLPDGTLDIIDYKSGRQTVSSEDIAHDLAMGVYQILVAHKYPDQPVQATIIALRSGVRATASLDADQRAELETQLTKLGSEILDRDYEELVPVYKDLCPNCDFLPLCRKHPEFLEPESGVEEA